MGPMGSDLLGLGFIINNRKRLRSDIKVISKTFESYYRKTKELLSEKRRKYNFFRRTFLDNYFLGKQKTLLSRTRQGP